jgi:hypothetical protein
MVKFIDVDPANIPTTREGRRGRVSYPILKSFLETGKVCVQLDRTGIQSSFQALYSMMGSYIKNHDLPIKIFSSGGEIFFMRLDLDNEGNEVPDWRTKNAKATDGRLGLEADTPATPLNAAEVATRYTQEKGRVTK